MVSNIFGKLRWLISSIAVFVAIWSVIVIIITVAWYMVPLCSEEFLLGFRWQVGLMIMIYLLGSRHLKIN